MSQAILCDYCDSMLRVDRRGDDEHGERAAWIGLTVAGRDYEVCTLICAVEFLQTSSVAEAVDAQLEAVSEIARVIREGQENP